MFGRQAFFRNEPIDLIVIGNDWFQAAGTLVIYEALKSVANLF